jgi:septum formation protein
VTGPRLILASASPRRREILTRLGVSFEVAVAEVEETVEGDPGEVALANAERKAAAVADEHPAAVVLGADTVVALAGEILPKPRDDEQARAWLERLSGREHRVITAIAVVDAGTIQTAVSTTAVRFRSLSDAEIEWYVASGEWRDRAGGYAIQGRGSALVASIAGDYWTVVGLPVPVLIDLLGPELVTGGEPGAVGP